MFIWAVFRQYFPYQFRSSIEKYSQKLLTFVYPYIQISFTEFTGERLMRSEAYAAIETYLSSTSSLRAKRLKADMVKNNQSLVLSMDGHEEVVDEFQGVKLWWKITDEKRLYKLTFHKKHWDLIIGPYLKHVLKQGKAIEVKNRQRKLYTNNGSNWSHVVFEHPATFQTLAMEPDRKDEIVEDLVTFSGSGEFYSRIGRAWKRVYLLYGPPGTGKSTMIAAMANLLGYDIYDLELTAVKDNAELRKLLIKTSSKSIIVVEDIDCSLDLTGQMKYPRQKENKEGPKTSHVTLSGLLNFIDGFWSACGGERLVVFTTNFVEELDPALIRKGRMDKHIHYHIVDSKHSRIQDLLNEVNTTPADVAEHLMPTSASGDPRTCLKSLILALESAKQAKDKELCCEEETP
ncbi:hypothetical protein V6N11_015553 [Hibiscus sabdariffa]|uniref:AAA+ ATPase domain-containing protein n=1 Tax=Hibiscus sabdariffa TaxID=183260 RepID=A0ABR2TSE9_9ROSI